MSTRLTYSGEAEKEGGADGRQYRAAGGQALLFLTDEQLRKGIEAMFFAYRGFTADPDRILAEKDYGRRITARSISSTAAPERR